MKINENVVIVGELVLLLPYEKCHVEKYHLWMQSPTIQQLTASEPLSLEEEYAMQKSWREDDDKLTFIIADKAAWNKFAGNHKSRKEESCIVGDVNLFLNDASSKETAEIEIMIAEPSARKRGFATESLRLMMAYALINLKITTFVAKIGCANTPSIHLFTNKLGFSEISRSEVFNEICFKKTLHVSDGSFTSMVKEEFGIDCLEEKNYRSLE